MSRVRRGFRRGAEDTAVIPESYYMMSPPPSGWRNRPRRALAEWIALADALTELGGEVVVLPPPDVHPALFELPLAAHWGALPFPGAAFFVLSHLRHAHRRPEQAHVARFVTDVLGLEVRTLDDVWEGQADLAALAPERYLLTWGPLTTLEGCEALRRHLPDGAWVLEVRLRDRVRHGLESVLVLEGPARRVALVNPADLADASPTDLAFFGGDLEVVPVTGTDAAAGACGALQVGASVLAEPGLGRDLTARIEALGLAVRPFEAEELLGRDGGLRAFVNRVPGPAPASAAPFSWRRRRAEIAAWAADYPDRV